MTQMQMAFAKAGFPVQPPPPSTPPAFIPPAPNLGGYVAELQIVRRHFYALRRKRYTIQTIRKAFASGGYLLTTNNVLFHPDRTAALLV